MYRGVGSAVVGSAPGAAFFFCTYEGVKGFLASSSFFSVLPTLDVLEGGESEGRGGGIGGGGGGGIGGGGTHTALTHMLAASLGEVAACAVRVPTEVVKQRAQAGQHGGSSWGALRAILSTTSTPQSSSSSSSSSSSLVRIWRELYRGWGITVMREVPFTVIQFPLWEALKAWGVERRNRRIRDEITISRGGTKGAGKNTNKSTSTNTTTTTVGAAESALYGSFSGAVAAAVTTPLDVLKTRVMLSRERARVLVVLREIWAAHGVRPFFAGIGPRVAWISAGGAIFLGSYQWAVNALQGQLAVL